MSGESGSLRVLRRLLAAIPLAAGIVLVTFALLRLLPGDPVDIMMGQAGNVSEAEIETLRRQLGLDRPIWEQAVHFARGMVRGDLGRSIRTARPVTALIGEALPATLELAAAALLFAVAVAVPVGVLSAVRHRSAFDHLAMGTAFVGISMPAFWLGLVLILLFGVALGWLPTSGRIDPSLSVPAVTGFMLVDTLLARDPAAFRSALEHLVLPAVTLGAELAAVLSRVVRSSMLDVLQADYVRVARAKGVNEWRVVSRHALRNALVPAVTVLGLQVGILLGGNMIVETVFSWPGLGRLVVGAIFARDYPVVQGAVLLYALTFLAANLLVDVLYTVINPRMAMG
ncbi:MAG TPA: ABC transporter permease [Limnochordales bacterium]